MTQVIVLSERVCPDCGKRTVFLSHPVNDWRHADGRPCPKRYDWAICDEDGVCDRYATEEEAVAALSSHPAGCYVEFVEDPGELL